MKRFITSIKHTEGKILSNTKTAKNWLNTKADYDQACQNGEHTSDLNANEKGYFKTVKDTVTTYETPTMIMALDIAHPSFAKLTVTIK